MTVLNTIGSCYSRKKILHLNAIDIHQMTLLTAIR